MNDLEMTSGHLLILANLHVKFEDSRSKHTKVIPWNKNFNIFEHAATPPARPPARPTTSIYKPRFFRKKSG